MGYGTERKRSALGKVSLIDLELRGTGSVLLLCDALQKQSHFTLSLCFP